MTNVWLPSSSYSKSCGDLAMWTLLVTDATSSRPLVGDTSAAVHRTGARRHLPHARDGAAKTANGVVKRMRMALLGLTAAYYTISAAMRLQCGRNPIHHAKCRGVVSNLSQKGQPAHLLKVVFSSCPSCFQSKHSNILTFQHSNIPTFKHSNINLLPVRLRLSGGVM